MINENLQDFMKKVEFKSKDVVYYINKDKGSAYPLSPAHLLCRVDKLELTKEELERAFFEMKVDKKEYKFYSTIRQVPKYNETKLEADKNKIIDKKIMATRIYNVSNQAGIHQSFENFDEAIKLFEEINTRVIEGMK